MAAQQHPNQTGVPSVVVAQQGAQLPANAAALMAGQQLSAQQQLQALAAASGGALFLPAGIPGMRIAMPTASMVLPPGLALPTTVAVQQQTPQLAGYRDYSQVFKDGASPSKQDHSFPMKLHKILSNPEYSEFITWLPHGRSWRVVKPKAFEEKVIPKFFRHAKYASFMRQVNGWGFKRMAQGPDHNSYYHELFLRGLPKLCQKMKRPAKTAHGMIGTMSAHPDFYSMSLYAPLPNQQPASSVHAVSTSPTNNYSESDASDRDVVNSLVTTYPAISTYSAPSGTISDSDRNGSSQDVSGCSDEGDRNSGGSSGGRDDSSLLSNKQADLLSIIGGASQDVAANPQLPLMVGLGAAGLGLPATAVALSGIGQVRQAGSSGVAVPMPLAAVNQQPLTNLTAPLTAPLTAANLGTVNPQLSAVTANPLMTAPLTAANLSLSAGTASQPLTAPLTATNLGYLSLQNQLLQSQATIAQLLAYQQQMGLPPMPAALGQQPTPGAHPANAVQQQPPANPGQGN